MKKILPMILLLSFSLPAMSAEVKLNCTITEAFKDKLTYNIVHTVDSVKGTIDGHKDSDGGYSFSDTSMGYMDRDKGDFFDINRVDGTYRGTSTSLSQNFSGHCEVLKQAF